VATKVYILVTHNSDRWIPLECAACYRFQHRPDSTKAACCRHLNIENSQMTLVPRNIGASKLAQSNHFAEQSGSELSELPHCYVNVKVFFEVSPRGLKSGYVFCFSLISTLSRGCGNCGKLAAFWAKSFPSLVETGGRIAGGFFHRFPQGGRFHSLGPLPLSGRRPFPCLTSRETDCYSWHGTATVTLH